MDNGAGAAVHHLTSPHLEWGFYCWVNGGVGDGERTVPCTRANVVGDVPGYHRRRRCLGWVWDEADSALASAGAQAAACR